jgi:hypothetical protein
MTLANGAQSQSAASATRICPVGNAELNPVTSVLQGYADSGTADRISAFADFKPPGMSPPPSPAGGPLATAAVGMIDLPQMIAGTTMTACFVAGTSIAVRHGATPVDDLREGDEVATVSGLYERVVWIGRREVDLAALHDDGPARPIRIAAGAFGEGLPCRELGLSGGNAVFSGGVFVPIRSLINGSTVSTNRSVRTVTYFHVELSAHQVILAEGLPVGSWHDTGNRAMFDNATPVEAIGQARRSYARDGYALLVDRGPIVDELRAALLTRALALGQRAPAEVSVAIGQAHLLRFQLPREAGSVRLLSSSGQRGLDLRRLGALIGGLRVDETPLPLYGAYLERGFHACERYRSRLVRWTDGDATMRFRPADATRWLDIEILATVPECAERVP